jgi:LytR cell envelope-related transcriptional attenuator
MGGKHAAPFRMGDFFTIIGGIAVVAGLVYFLLSALLGGDPPATTTTTAATSTSSTVSTTTSTTVQSTTTTSAPTTSTTVAVRPPSEVRVLVLNSIGVDGLASQVTARLSDLGYNTLPPDNYTPLLERTRVWYVPGFEAEAFVLAAEFPDAQIEQNPDLAVDADVVVVLGDSYEP